MKRCVSKKSKKGKKISISPGSLTADFKALNSRFSGRRTSPPALNWNDAGAECSVTAVFSAASAFSPDMGNNTGILRTQSAFAFIFPPDHARQFRSYLCLFDGTPRIQYGPCYQQILLLTLCRQIL